MRPSLASAQWKRNLALTLSQNSRGLAHYTLTHILQKGHRRTHHSSFSQCQSQTSHYTRAPMTRVLHRMFSVDRKYTKTPPSAALRTSQGWPHESPPKPPPTEVGAKVAEMHAMVAKYTADFPKHIPRVKRARPGGGESVLVTGSSGALGANILAQLLGDPDVFRLYASNRPHREDLLKPKLEKQIMAMKARGLDHTLMYTPRFRLLEADMTVQGFNIAPKLFNEVKSSITLIIHNAWPVHFTKDLSTFEPVIRGLRHLIDFALESPQEQPPRLLFVSSAGVIMNADSSQLIPETSVEARTAVGMGYTESKWVAERILEICAEKTPLKPIIVRVGQLTGGINGAWNTREWLPGLARAGQVLGCLPMREDNIGWLPVHNAATAIIEAWNSPNRYLTLVHPRPVPWATVFEPLAASVNASLVPFSTWVEELEQKNWQAHDPRLNPTIRLLNFYQTSNLGISNFSTANARTVSNTLASLRPLARGDVAQWVDYWRKIKFLE